MYLERRRKPSLTQVIGMMFQIMACVMCLGFSLSGNVDVSDVMSVQQEWGDKFDTKNKIISTAPVLGMTIGAIGSNLVTEWGRRRSLLLCNLVITVVTLPNFFINSYWYFVFARFIMGLASAVSVNGTSLYFSECLPTEHQSKVGISINIGIVFGIFATGVIGLALPPKDDAVQVIQDDYLWRISYSL